MFQILLKMVNFIYIFLNIYFLFLIYSTNDEVCEECESGNFRKLN